MKDKALRQALEFLEQLGENHWGNRPDVIATIKEALAQAEKEPLEYWNAVEGWVKIEEVREHFDFVGCGTIYKTSGEDRVPLYTTPPQRPWVGLTDDEINEIYEQAETLVHDSWVGKVGLMFPITLCKMFEDKLKEKNHE